MSDIEDATLKAQTKASLLTSSMMAFGDILVQVAQGGSITFKKFVAGMLQAVAQVLFAFGAALIAKGFMTDNHEYTRQGVIAIAAGIATNLAAAALSGGGGGAGPPGGGRGGGASPEPVGRSQNITVNVLGSIPLGVSADEFARMIASLLRTASADGA